MEKKQGNWRKVVKLLDEHAGGRAPGREPEKCCVS
jgi:hypothetical protein